MLYVIVITYYIIITRYYYTYYHNITFADHLSPLARRWRNPHADPSMTRSVLVRIIFLFTWILLLLLLPYTRIVFSLFWGERLVSCFVRMINGIMYKYIYDDSCCRRPPKEWRARPRWATHQQTALQILRY